MRRIKSLEQLRLERKRLDSEKEELLINIKNEWQVIKKSNKPVRIAGQFISGVIVQSIFKNGGQAYMAEKATIIAVDFIKKSFLNVKKWLSRKKK